jgi:hypothetical protein
MISARHFLLFVAVLGLVAGRARAQWLTQELELRPGWNAVQLHVDAGHDTLDALIGADGSNPVEEVWLWTPAIGTAQFIQTPQVPSGTISQWASWKRALGPASELSRLTGPAACLVRVADVGSNYVLRLRGRVVPPRYVWTSTGLNFLGLPAPTNASVNIEQFFRPGGDILRELEVYRYGPGELDAGNPARIFSLRNTPVRRGEAFWLRAGSVFNRYFGPLDVESGDPRGALFGTRQGEQRVRIRNRADRPVTVRLRVIASETAPAGQTVVAGLPPLALRGEMNPTNLTFPHAPLTEASTNQWILTAAGLPGSDVELVIGLDRFAMAGAPGSLFASVLRFTDSLGLSQIDIPVSAETGSLSGLWVGDAQVTRVRHQIARYDRSITNGEGRPQLTMTLTNLAPVARAFPVRVLMHVEGTNAVLLQRVFIGLDPANNRVVATRESALNPEKLSDARRLSSVSFPWSENNQPWPMQGGFLRDGTLAAVIDLGFDDQRSNPFLHTFHPDHDNLNSDFDATLPAGRESWSVRREVRLNLHAPADDFRSVTRTGDQIDAWYDEAITLSGSGGEAKTYDVSGHIVLRRIADVPVLTRN